MFAGRKKELEILNKFYDDETGKSACIYGRLGIGKTSLAKEFSKDKKSIYFNAYATTGHRETELFARVVGVGKSKLTESQTPVEQLNVIFEAIRDKADLEQAPIVLIIDNYPLFAKAEPEFDAALFDFISEESKIKLIMIGDTYLGMSKLFHDKKSLWKGNVSVDMELCALGFYEAMDLLEEMEDIDTKVKIYGITGGNPAALSCADNSARDTIENIYCKKNAPLPDDVLQNELRELSYYNNILTTLAEGKYRVNQISQVVNKPKDVVVPYMNTLMSIGMVTKENPVTEKTNRKKTRYSIINSYDLFWYKFFSPYMDLYESGGLEDIVELSINPEMPNFMHRVFVSMCKEYLDCTSGSEKLPFIINEIGNWWQNNDEKMTSEDFDLVALGEAEGEEALVFCRCYYIDEPVGIATLKALIDLTKQVKGKKNVFYVVFSKNGFHENTVTVASSIKNILLVSLEDIINV